MGTLPSGALPLPGAAEILGTAIGAITSGASFGDVVQVLAKNAFISLTPVGVYAAPIQLAGQTIQQLFGKGQTLGVHAYFIDPTLPPPESKGDLSFMAAELDYEVYRAALLASGRPLAYVDGVLDLEAEVGVASYNYSGTFSTGVGSLAGTSRGIARWEETVQVFKGKGLSGWIYEVPEDARKDAGLVGNVSDLAKADIATVADYDAWKKKVDTTYRDKGDSGLEKLLADSTWKARSIYWKLLYDLATGGPSPELLELLAQAEPLAYPPQPLAKAPGGAVLSDVLVALPELPGATQSSGGLEEGFVPPPPSLPSSTPLSIVPGLGSALSGPTFEGEGVVSAPEGSDSGPALDTRMLVALGVATAAVLLLALSAH